MVRYAITSRTLFPGEDRQQQAALIRQCARWAADGIDFIQLREKDLPAAALADLARGILAAIPIGSGIRLLINSRADVALATGAHGVHLTAAPGELTAAQIRHLYAAAGHPEPVVTVSCHTLAEVAQARIEQPDAILFAPVFGKSIGNEALFPAAGLEALRAACAAASPIPIYALGGITPENALACIGAGAAGIAGIRLFRD
jgi:thiamine-phosphate pyrophosphorylase